MPRLLLAAVAFTLAAPFAAQDVQGDGQDERLDALERKNQDLEARVAELEGTQDTGAVAEPLGLGMEVHYADIGATFQIFGDVGASYENPAPPGEAHTSAFLGSVDFFVNMRLGDQWRVLSETVIESKSNDQISTSQERLWGAWVPADWFYAKFGTEHSGISRWNQLYHHGRWLETSIRRPLLASFEGSQGVLPLHRTGLTLGGTAHTDVGRFEYFGTVSNGRGELPSDKQRNADVDEQKAIDLGLAFEPFGESDWRFGVAVTKDTIPPDPASADPARARSIGEWIYTGHVEWRNGSFYGLGEVALIDHEVKATSEDFSGNVSYVQAEYRFGDWTPYARFDHRNMDEGDPFYSPLGRDLDVWYGTLGLRWDVGTNVAIKLESSAGREDFVRGSGSIGERGLVFVGLQLSWWL